MKKTVLLFGGNSEERLVSVASAQNLATKTSFSEIWFLHQTGATSLVSKDELIKHENPFQVEFKPHAAPFATQIETALSELKDKTIYIALHGTEGEDGVLQAFFEKNKIAFTGSGSTSSQNAFDKGLAKTIVAKHGIAIAPALVVDPTALVKSDSDLVSFFEQHKKIVLKPLANGSSIGLFIAHDTNSIKNAIHAICATNYGQYLAEKFIEGRELTAGVFENGETLIALPPSEVVLNAGHSFDYQGKYLGRGTTEITPASLTPDEVAAVQLLSKTAHQALGCYGYSRTDIMLTNEGPVFLETNTLPGLTKASFIPQQLAAANIEFTKFIELQLHLAESRFLK